MMKPASTAAYWTAVGVLVLGLSACGKEESAQDEKGPAERAGQQLDQAASRAGEELSKAAEAAGKGLQELGQKIQNAAEEQRDAQKKE